MKVLAVNAPNVPNTDRDILMPQIDLMQGAGLLERLGHEVAFYDMDAKRHDEADLQNKLVDYKPDFMYMLFDEVVQIHSHEGLDEAMKMSKAARKTGTKVLMGGTIPSFFHERILGRGEADAVLIGPPGPALLELFSDSKAGFEGKRRLARLQNGKVAGPGIMEKWLTEGFTLDESYGLAARHLVDESDYPIDVRSIATSRGCRPRGKGCSFCPYSTFWGARKEFSTEHVLRDIGQVLERGHGKIILLDSTFTYNPESMKRMAEGIVERGYKVKFGDLSRADMDLRYLDALQKAGLSFIHYGVESGDDATLYELRKGITTDQIRHAFDEAKQRGLRTRASIIIDAGKTRTSVDRTVDLMLEVKPDEIKAHFLSPRIYSEHGKEITWDRQSIFGDKTTVENPIKEYARERLDGMCSELGKEGYVQLLDSYAAPGFWKGLWEKGEMGENVRFISVAPARYGICW
ncbi:MAG: radical SAM protein [Candidatus Aenigmatarchaeota archaeon]